MMAGTRKFSRFSLMYTKRKTKRGNDRWRERTVTERCLTPRQLYLSTDLSIYQSIYLSIYVFSPVECSCLSAA